MELSFTEEQLEFRDEVREWIATAMPREMAAKVAVDADFSMDDVMEWHRILYRKGWVAPNWPTEHGGPGLDPTSRFILTDELQQAGTPGLSPFGLSMVGPLIIQFGTDEQKARYLPKVLSGDEVWCQGYSEPNAGSDLASLKTTAEPDGKGNYVVNGQKTWTTYAQYADWIFCLVRTSSAGKRQQGISFLLIKTDSPGLEIKPMRTIADNSAFCETFLTDVVVPVENRVGPEGGGWTLAKALLGHERTLIAAIGTSQRYLRRLKRIAQSEQRGQKKLWENPVVRARIAELEVSLRALQVTNYRTLAGAQLGKAPGPESSILKLRGSEIGQALLELSMELMGENSMTWHNDGAVPDFEASLPPAFAYMRANTIYGGSNEIQKNIIAKHILGLPS